MIIGFITNIVAIFIGLIVISIFTKDHDSAVGIVGIIWFIYMIIGLFSDDGLFMNILGLVGKVIELLIAVAIFYSITGNKKPNQHQNPNDTIDADEQRQREAQRQQEEADRKAAEQREAEAIQREQQRQREEAEAKRRRDEEERRVNEQRKRDEKSRYQQSKANQQQESVANQSNEQHDDLSQRQADIRKLIIAENNRQAEEKQQREAAARKAKEQQRQQEEAARQREAQKQHEEEIRQAEEKQQREEAARQREAQRQHEEEVRQAEAKRQREAAAKKAKHPKIDFKNKIIQKSYKNTDYIQKFGDMNEVMIHAQQNIAETDKLIDSYMQRQWRLPFNLTDYNTFKQDLAKANLNYWVQKRGYDGEKRAYDDIVGSINNTSHSYFYCKILTDVNVPFTYESVINDEDTNHQDEVKREGSTQIDILLISNYGVFALEVKNYNADHISIEGVKTKNNKQRFERINGELVPLAYIKRSFNDENQDDKLMDGNNKISHQTFLHEKAMINFVKEHLGMSTTDAKDKVHSTFVYANEGIDQYGKNKDNEPFLLGNNVQSKSWAFKATAISSKGCFPWIINFNKPDGRHKFNSLSNDEVNKLFNLLQPYSGPENEIAHRMYLFNASPKEFQKFIGRLFYLNDEMKQRLKNH